MLIVQIFCAARLNKLYVGEASYSQNLYSKHCSSLELIGAPYEKVSIESFHFYNCTFPNSVTSGYCAGLYYPCILGIDWKDHKSIIGHMQEPNTNLESQIDKPRWRDCIALLAWEHLDIRRAQSPWFSYVL